MVDKRKDILSLKDQNLIDKFKEAHKKKISMRDFIKDFINQYINPETKKAYINDLNNFFNFLKRGDVLISHPQDIQAYHFQFYRDELLEKGYASASVNRKMVAIRSFIKWALALKLIDHNPLDVVKLPRVKTEHDTLAFDDHEVIKMINAPDIKTPKGNMERVAMILLFNLGLRRSELINIKIKDFYQERGHNVLIIYGKGNKERHLPLNDFLTLEIQSYISFMQNHQYIFEHDDYLLQSQKTKHNKNKINGSTIYRVINNYAKKCNINKRVSPHSARATAISHLLDTHKTPIRDVAIFAGHVKITTTERYDKRRKSLDNSAAYQVNYLKKSS